MHCTSAQLAVLSSSTGSASSVDAHRWTWLAAAAVAVPALAAVLAMHRRLRRARKQRLLAAQRPGSDAALGAATTAAATAAGDEECLEQQRLLSTEVGPPTSEGEAPARALQLALLGGPSMELEQRLLAVLADQQAAHQQRRDWQQRKPHQQQHWPQSQAEWMGPAGSTDGRPSQPTHVESLRAAVLASGPLQLQLTDLNLVWQQPAEQQPAGSGNTGMIQVTATDPSQAGSAGRGLVGLGSGVHGKVGASVRLRCECQASALCDVPLSSGTACVFATCAGALPRVQ